MKREQLLKELNDYMSHIIRTGDEMPLEVWFDDNNAIDAGDLEEIGYHLRYACEYICKYVDK